MVLQFFRRPDESGLEHVARQIVAMLVDCRHGFDAAMSAVLGGADPAVVGQDVRETDRRVNAAEHEVRRELVVHVSVRGGADVGSVLGSLLVVKKVERIGDQTKNLFDLADEGVSLVDAPDRDRLIALRDETSAMIAEAAELFADPHDDRAEDFLDRCGVFLDRCNEEVRALLHTDAPGFEAVPRALLWRYVKRIVANLEGAVATLVRPLADVDRYTGDLDE